MKKIFTFALLSITSVSMFGKPANPGLVSVTQPDGTQIQIRLEGDEHGHLVFDAYGRLLTKDSRGFYVDAGATENDIKAKRLELQNTRTKRLVGNIGTRAATDGSNYGLISLPKPVPCTGEIKCAVVLVEYPNQKFTIPNPQDFFSRMLNEEGFSQHGAIGSARDYYRDNSQGLFTVDFDVYGPVMLPQEYAYYGANDLSTGHDTRPEEMAIHACQALDDTVDFSQYDFNQDGQIDFVYLIYAGYGEADGAPAETIWPHAWSLDQSGNRRRYIFDDVRLNRYACSNELQLADSTPDGIGSIVHEFSHILGLPDHYSSGGYTYDTPCAMDIMDTGCYNNNSRTPPNYNALELYALGWMEPQILTEEGDYELENLHDSRQALMVLSKQNPKERYFFENRQLKGNDQFLRCHGLLVWHVEFNQDVWNSNNVNNDPYRRGVDLVPADNTYGPSTLAGDSFPGTTGKTSFTPSTTPAFLTWERQPLGFSITQIKESDSGVISFHVESSTSGVDVIEDNGSDIIVNGNSVSVANGEALVFDTLGRHIVDIKGSPVTLPGGVYIIKSNRLQKKIIIR